jgi:hypothetical protein
MGWCNVQLKDYQRALAACQQALSLQRGQCLGQRRLRPPPARQPSPSGKLPHPRRAPFPGFQRHEVVGGGPWSPR